MNANGSFTFTPPAAFTGATSFTYRAVNGFGPGNTATVTLTFTTTLPTTVPDAVLHHGDGVEHPGARCPGQRPDERRRGALGTTGHHHDERILALASDGSFSYTPNAGFQGADSFTYRAVNNVGPGNVATVSITIASSGPQPPTELYAAFISGNTVTLRFTAPTTGPAPTGYVLEGGIAPGEVLASIPTGSAYPIYTFTAPTGSFYVRVHTLAGALRSLASNEIRIYVNVAVAPSAPANLTGLANGTSIALAWRNTFAGGAAGRRGPGRVGVAQHLTPARADGQLPVQRGARRHLHPRRCAPPTPRAAAPRPTRSPSPSRATIVWLRVRRCRRRSSSPTAWETPSTCYGIRRQTGRAPTSFVLNVTGAFGGSFGTVGRGLSGVVGPGTYHLSVAATNACGSSAVTATQTVVVP